MTARIGSLFSGAGGLDLAVEHVTGGRTVWHCEANPDASKVLAAQWPDVPNLGDITAVDWSQVEPVDVLCGGFPCQDVSAAGRRAGIASGTRSGLWLEYAEAINQLRPQLVVIENVRGLLSGYAHRAMEPGTDDLGDRSSRPLLRAAGAVLGDLADLGFNAQWTTVAASEIGAPHRRERVFIVATPADADHPTRDGEWSRQEPWGRSEDASTHATGDRRNQGRSESTGLIGRPDAAISGMPAATDPEGNGRPRFNGGAGGPQACGGRERQPSGSTWGTSGPVDLLPTPTASDGSGGGIRTGLSWEGTTKSTGQGGNSRLRDVVGLLPTPKASDGARGDCPGERKRNKPSLVSIEHYLPTPCASDATGGGAHPNSREGHSRQLIDYALLDGTAQWGKYEPAIRRWEAITREAPSPTEPGARGNPRLAARFSEWMQGWPLGWVTSVPISRSAQLRIIGNGVVPQQAIAALYWLLSVSEVAA
jgi:DNA (cytosine-5)-methyltransferase 1